MTEKARKQVHSLECGLSPLSCVLGLVLTLLAAAYSILDDASLYGREAYQTSVRPRSANLLADISELTSVDFTG